MSSGVNKVILLGRLGKDPEVKEFTDGNKVANLTLATTERYKVKGEKKEVTEWHNLTMYGPKANLAENFLKKGELLYVEGAKRSRKYTNKDGVEVTHHYVQVDRLQFVGGSKRDEGASTPLPTADAGDDVPF